MPPPASFDPSLRRREFLASLATTGLLMSLPAWPDLPALEPTPERPKSKDDIHVAVIGYGAEGRVLVDSCLSRRPNKNKDASQGDPIQGLRFKAVCDIRLEACALPATRLLKKYHHIANPYQDFREMLAKEKDLDAVIVASPDWMHAEHTNACLRAGLHVYCEKEMANSLEKARSMVLAARETGKLLQIGHQRRSNPRYRHAIDTLVRQHGILGRLTHAQAQWNRSAAPFEVSASKYDLDQSVLEKYGYASMSELLNWRWYRKYGGGPLVDLGSHQIDLFSWIFGCPPSSVVAVGGNDTYVDREWHDNVMAHYEFKTPEGIKRASYQVLTTSQFGGFYEAFLGLDGTLVISEVVSRGNYVQADNKEVEKKWEQWIAKGYLKAPPLQIKKATTKDVDADVRVSMPAGTFPLAVELNALAHVPHLENFFDAIRHGTPLNCPAELAFETAVAVFKANEAVAAGRRLDFKPDEFRA